nr:hypothetical protein CFP56_74562 [Quercus suber]
MGGLHGSITGDLCGRVIDFVFLSRATDSRGRGSIGPALRLGRGLCAGYESANGHFSSCHQIFVLNGLGFALLGCLDLGLLGLAFVPFDKDVFPLPKSLGNSLG